MTDPRDVLNEDLGPTSLWTRVNIAEAIPGVPTPLTWSWSGPSSDIGVSRAWVKMGALPASRGSRQQAVADRMVAIHAGHPLLNLGILREIGDSIPGHSGDKVESSLFYSEELVSGGRTPHRARYPHVAVKLLPAILGARRWLLSNAPKTERWWENSVRTLSTRGDPRAALVDSFDRYTTTTTYQTIATLSTSGIYDALVRVCAQHGLQDQAGALSTSNEPTPEAVTVQDLWLVSRGEQDMERFLARHGYHAPVQGELAVPSWRMDPGPVLKLVDSYRRCDDSEEPDLAQRRIRAARRETERQLLSAVSAAARPAVRLLIRATQSMVPMRETARMQFMQCYDVARAAADMIARDLLAQGAIVCRDDVFYLTVDELVSHATIDKGLVAYRRERHEYYQTVDLPVRFRGLPKLIEADSVETECKVLTGLSGSRGVYEGRARIVTTPDDADELLDGEILVCETTNPSWASYFLVAGAVVVDIGGPLSHGPIVAREMGIPCVINTRDARHVIKTGDRIRVDGTAGTVEILDSATLTGT